MNKVNMVDYGVVLDPNKEWAYKIMHAGWLLQAVSPALVAKGEHMFNELSERDQELATAYSMWCLTELEKVHKN